MHEGLDRREFLKKSLEGAAFIAMPRWVRQVSSPATQETDPFADIDTANIDLVNSKIESGDDEEFDLDLPRLALLGHLNLQPFTPDVGFGVLSDSNGVPYALIYNHNMNCIREPLEEAGLLVETEIYDGPKKGTVLDPGVSEIRITPVDPSLRLENMTVQRFLDEYRVEISGVEMTLPVLVVKEFGLNGETFDCPTATERIGGVLGDAIEGIQDKLSNFEFGETLESAGEAVGKALGNIVQGTARGLREGLTD